MAYNKDQNEPKLPSGSGEKRESSNLLPRFYRTNSNKKFLQATLDQLIQPGTVKKVNGYLGRQYSATNKSSDIFLEAADKSRQDYQLEPAAVISDYLGNTTFLKDYIDHINHIDVLGGNVKNHSRLNKQEFYSWNPHINWDKFVNFQQYYWLPFGPSPINITGQQQGITSTYSITLADEVDNKAFLFNPEGPSEGLVRNPTITLFRGQTYIFDINCPSHPFSLKTERSEGSLDRYSQGVIGNGTEVGSIKFEVPFNAPDVLYYVSENAIDTAGVFHILDIEENTLIDVTAEILGKKTYSIPNTAIGNVALSNGMKLRFIGVVVPEQYSTGFWYVEGVGDSIKLISEKELEIRSTYVEESSLLFDDVPFDQLPFSEVGSLPSRKDYITINRSSPDSNPWSRYNRWFHADVIKTSADINLSNPQLDQKARAIRPIIEFNAGLKLFNFGVVAKKTVDLIDNFTIDAFSTVEGSLGYSVDGIDLVDGMRIIFNADKDILVKNKTYKVNFINIVSPGRKINFSPESEINLDTSTVSFSSEHGLATGNRVTYLSGENDSIPGLANRNIYWVQVIDQLTVSLYKDSKLTKQAEILGVVSGVHSFELYSGKKRQIHLTEENDVTPNDGESVSIRFGTEELLANSLKGNQGQSYWFSDDRWVLSQSKISVNQPPLFDLFDAAGDSFSNTSKYDGSNFKGNKLFGYKESSAGVIDAELGFPLTYQNINNIGDIVFDFYLLENSFAYKIRDEVFYKKTDTGFLKLTEDFNRFSFVNGWITSQEIDYQPVIRTYTSKLGTQFDIDVFDDIAELEDLVVKVFINGKKISSDNYTVETGNVYKFVKLKKETLESDIVVLKCFSKQVKNNNGHYEFPINLQNNPLNSNLSTFTLGQVTDHVNSIVNNLDQFTGVFPGSSNLKDLGNISSFGTKFVQHSGSLNLPLYFFGSKEANIIKALDKTNEDYNKFKRSFILSATDSKFDGSVKDHVDLILAEVSKDKPKTNPYYLSDMVAYSGYNKIEYTVLDSRIKAYPLTRAFNLSTLSNKSVLIYLNGLQLLEGKDYIFGDSEFFEIRRELVEDDIIEAFEYNTTDGCFCPATPTKLGMFPKYEPSIYVDDTYVTPTKVIQGHDGSIVIAFNDYRDDLILELEKRIYNNIKVQYDTSIFDIYDYIPGYNRNTLYSVDEYNNVLLTSFFKWLQLASTDFTKNTNFDSLNPFTYNLVGSYAPNNTDAPRAWKGVYNWMFDTVRPHTHPWECLGFSIKPQWWENAYGPAPYTKDNLLLWEDIKTGTIREPNQIVTRNKKFERPILENRFPVDENGDILSPLEAGFLIGILTNPSLDIFSFGDFAPVENAWRRSSYYPFAVLRTLLLLSPADILGKCLDRSRMVRDLSNQLVYSDTGLRLTLNSLKIPTVSLEDTNSRTYTAGLINYIIDYLISKNLNKVDKFRQDLSGITNRLSSRLGAFTSKQKYRILLDSKNPGANSGVFIPEENYSINLSVSSALKKVAYSGVIITKLESGFEIKGYNYNDQFFTVYPFRLDGSPITVGGISEIYANWEPDRYYVAGKVVRFNSVYYRVRVSHTSGSIFDNNLYARLSELPLVGGKTVKIRAGWDYSSPIRVGYNTILSTIQDVADFLQGYGEFLKNEGFVFDDFNNNLSSIANWITSVKEFLTWTGQTWAVGSTISLSPAANKLTFKSNNAVVDNIIDSFYEYNIFKVDGKKLEPELIDVYRTEDLFSISPTSSAPGIYCAVFHLVQKEHIVLFDNTTMFNDIIYDKETGYKQDRLKVLAYVTSNWNGSFETPGFIYDQIIIENWEPWTDYNLGDIVKYKEFYYSAKTFLPGADVFNYENWNLSDSKLESRLLPNWDYKAEQFTDFYDLDTDNFDVDQQKVAQHLIGYQKRQYLENIINNDVSQYKFYQGMITEKGTQNVFNKLFDVLSSDEKESLTFDEEWAFRVGEYGAVDSFDEIEIILDESEFKLNPQPLELVDRIDPSVIDFVYRQTESDIYIKPKNYTTNLWTEQTPNRFLRTPGHVRKEDIFLSVDSLDSLLAITDLSYKEGGYIQTAFEGNEWNVYRITKTDFKILEIQHNKLTTLVCDKEPDLKIGDIIRIDSSPDISAFCKILDIRNSLIDVSKIKDTPVTINPIVSFYLKSVRFTNIDDVNDRLDYRLNRNETVWVDDVGTGLWGIFKNNAIYSSTDLRNPNPATNLSFGKVLSITSDGNICAVSSEVLSGERSKAAVIIFEKSNTNPVWRPSNTFYRKTPESFDSFGDATKFSKDGEWFVIAAPLDGFFYLYKRQVNRKYEFISEIAGDAGLGTNLDFVKIDKTYFLSAYNPNTSIIRVYKNNSQINNEWELYDEVSGMVGDEFGYDFSMTSNAGVAVLVVTAPKLNKVFVYSDDGTSFILDEEIEYNPSIDDFENFGKSITVSENGKYIAVGANLVDVKNKSDVGAVVVYKKVNASYQLIQVINTRIGEVNEQFGSRVEFMNDDTTLAIFSFNKDSVRQTTFDKELTTFDKASCIFGDLQTDAAVVDIYDRYNETFLFGETLLNPGNTFDKYGYDIATGKNTILISAINRQDRNFVQSGVVLSYSKPNNTTSWIKTSEQSLDINISKIKKAFLYNKKTSELVTYLDVVDSQQGKLPGVADQEIKFKTYYDPAIYSAGLSVNVDEGLNWTADHVGMLWWDLTRAKFNDNYTGDTLYKSSNWNKLYDTASIDIYEWVETNLLPESWAELADTEEGYARGISGTPKYGNNVYSVNSYFDNISKKIKNTYYYWVKNKKTAPNVEGRSLSSFDVSRLISDPVAYGYPCIAFNSSNSISLVNLDRYLEDKNIVLNIQYWLTDNRTNYHSQWKLLSLNKNTIIPTAIETKWFHSLIGKDDAGRLVPDFKIPFKNRYGIEFRPRQGMFINRIEALKQVVEKTNAVIKSMLIADTYNLSNLLQADLAPTIVSGEWDQNIDIEEELKFVATKNFLKPVFTPVVNNGKIIDITIVSPGNGYATFRPYQYNAETLDPIAWYGPDLQISGTGRGAIIKTIVNAAGQIIKIEIVNAGEGYDSDTKINIRSLSVLVTSDNFALESWTIYEWDVKSSKWNRIKSQAYNVTKYWKYIDWYKDDYDQFTKVDRIFENTHQLVVTDVPLNSVVKINNIGTGGWMLLRKFNNKTTIDYTENYEVIARQNGTIEFLNAIYKPSTTYDNLLLDSNLYDNYPVIELKIILESIRDNILIDQHRVEYLKLFFSSIKYILHEQILVDWVFKTSFVKSQHNVGNLAQKITYKNDNLENFEEYIKEVKPYRTKVREFVSSYESLDPTKTVVTDFDLLPVVDETYSISPLTVKIVDNAIETEFEEINKYPWKNWADTLGFKITSVKIVDPGNGYRSNPKVEIVGDQLAGGIPAVAKAYIANGKVNRIDLINPGSKWIKAPTIILKGGLGVSASEARAVAIIGDSLARSNNTTIKFDRVSKTYQISNLEATETFIASGSKTQFPLIWSPNINTDSYLVYVNGAEALKNEYKLTSTSSFNGSFTEYAGLLTFVEPPVKGSEIIIEYHKNFNHLAATDRINFYYKPVAGQLGKDLSQLMTGVDYGGVAITGLGFDANYGWDNLPWFSEVWDATSPDFDDFIFDVSGDPVSYEIRLPYVPEKNQVLNIYISYFNPATMKYENPIRIDDPNYLTINQKNVNASMTSFVGDGEIDIIILPEAADLRSYDIDDQEYGDRVIIRKIESDGSLNARDDDYDTKLSGGNLAYSSATGFAPDDIILDGDDFVSAMTSHAPEEVVPGQIMDTLAIKVYSRPTGGCPNIVFKTHVGTGLTNEFIIGQYFPNNNSIIVKVNNEIVELDTDYTIDYQNNKIVLSATPANGVEVSIISIGFNSENILDLDYFVSDGETTEYITKAPWLLDINATVLVNGQVIPFIIFSTNSEYTDVTDQSWRSRVGIQFPEAPAAGSIINYIIDASKIQQTASVVKSQYISYQSGVSSYVLANPVGIDLPLEANVIVKTENNILSSPSYNYFTLSESKLNYTLQDSKYQASEVNVDNLIVYLDSKTLSLGTDYEVNLNYSVPLYGVDINNFVLEGGAGYAEGDVISLSGGTSYTNVATFLVASVLAGGIIQRAELIDPGLYIEIPTAPFVLTGGSGSDAGLSASFVLQQDLEGIEVSLVASRYVENGKLVIGVTSFADYSINDNTIEFNSVYPEDTRFEILSFYNHNMLSIERTVDTFTPSPVLDPTSPGYFEYNSKLGGVFKLNSTVSSGEFVWVIKNGNLLIHKVDYELAQDKQTVILNAYLTESDKVQLIAFTNTVVEDQFGFMQFKDIMNRTHYKRLNMDKVTSLVRGLGQQDRDIMILDPDALDDPIPHENKPGVIEINGERIEYFVKDGNVLRQLRRGTLGTGIPESHPSGTIIQNIGPSETIPYKDEYLVARSDEKRADGSLVHDNIYTTGTMFVEFVNTNPTDSIEVFVGGHRLKKNQYTLYTNNNYPYSPEGDTVLDPEFLFAGGQLQLREDLIPPPGTLVVVVKKQGRIWSDSNKRLANSENPIAKFVKAAKTVWPAATFRS